MNDAVERIMRRVYTQAEIAWQHERHDPIVECSMCSAHLLSVADDIKKLLTYTAAKARVEQAKKDAAALEWLAHKEPNLRNVECWCLWCTVGRQWITKAEADLKAIESEVVGT